MKLKIIIALIAFATMLGWQAEAQTYDTNNVVVQTFAGSAFTGYLDGQGQLTMFNNPSQIVTDSSNNLFVWDSGNHRIRKITPGGTVTTFAGGGAQSTGVGTNVSFDFNVSQSGVIGGLAIDHNNTIWMVMPNATLYRITSGAAVTYDTLSLASPTVFSGGGACADLSGNVYISDPSANKIYRYKTNGVLEIFAGSGNQGAADGNWVFTSFYNPTTLGVDAADNIYVWDSGNHLIRRISQNRDVVTVTGLHSGNFDGNGTNTGFSSISAMAADNSGNIYFACGNSIRKMDATTTVVTIAGSFSQSSYTNGAGNLARFWNASGVCLSQGSIFVADSGNQRIRQISFDPSTQVVSPASLQLSLSPSLQIAGTVGRTYQVQSSPDMTNWTTRATLLLSSSPYLWIDQNPVSGNKFYRALLLP